MNESLIAGVDIGGSHITVALIDWDKRVILDATWRRKLVDSMGSAESIIAAWSGVIRESFEAAGLAPTRLGIAMPGPFDYEEGIALMKNQNKYDALYGLNIKQLLAGQLGIPPGHISFANDAACFLQGEVVGGVARHSTSVMGLTLGTGLGTSRCINGRAEDANLWCSPFKEGMAEDYLSTRWFVRRYASLAHKNVRNVKELVDQGGSDPLVPQVFREFGTNLGEFLVPYVDAEGTELVVIGGNIAQTFPFFSSALQEAFAQKDIGVEVKVSQLGENATLMGAASYC